MSSEPEMSDAQFSNVFSLMIGGLIVLTIVLIILAVFVGSDVQKSDINTQVRDSEMTENLEPVGQIAIGEAPSSEPAASGSDDGQAAAEPQSGEAVYQSSCAACHASGVAGAPVFGEEGAWSDRVAQGKDTLYQHAIEGFQGSAGMMPAKGGNPSLSDEEVKAAVDHMVAAVAGDAAPETAAEESEAADTEAADTGAADTGAADTGAADTEAADTEAADTEAAGTEAADTGAAATAEEPTETAGAAGEEVYQSSCIACHASGVAGAPKLG
ncbi:MAG TPA: c-type cytochrome, partial [Arenicellales bacterium]|nr:c-type cytochrome [Arenicellales bacterium]